MLVLGRAVGQEIVLQTIDGPIRIKVLDDERNTSNRTKLGITAPKSVAITRLDWHRGVQS